MLINGVFEGGGVKGIALVGAVQAVEQKGYRFGQVAGTSSGAIVASLIAAGYTSEEMKDIILQTPFSSFLQRGGLYKMKLIGPTLRIMIKKGMYAGHLLELWIHKLLQAKGIVTFADLRPGQLRIIASDISRGRLLVLPDDIAQFGIDPMKLPVSKAIRMSTSIPYFFDPVILRRKEPRKKGEPFADQFIYIVDGALLSNFPLWLFDQGDSVREPTPTIGFQLVGQGSGETHRIAGPISMLQALFGTMLSAHDNRFIEDHYRFRTIQIPTLGVHTTQFHLSEEMSLKLFAAGYEAGSRYFGSWTYDKYKLNMRKTR